MRPMAVALAGRGCAAPQFSGPGPLAGTLGARRKLRRISDRLLPLPAGEIDTRLLFRRE